MLFVPGDMISIDRYRATVWETVNFHDHHLSLGSIEGPVVGIVIGSTFSVGGSKGESEMICCLFPSTPVGWIYVSRNVQKIC